MILHVWLGLSWQTLLRMNDNDTQTTNEDPILIVAKTSFVYDESRSLILF